MLRERAVHLIRSARSSACLPSPLSDIRSLPLVTLFPLKVCRSIPYFRCFHFAMTQQSLLNLPGPFL